MIEFPQTIDPWVNRDATEIVRRDVTQLCDYFVQSGVACDPVALADKLWPRYGPPQLEPVQTEDVHAMKTGGPITAVTPGKRV